MGQPIEMHLTTVLSILLFKLSALIIGYLVTRMGYELLVKGISGEFQFKGSISGVKADLVSASPGLLFLLLGVVIMGTAILKDKPFSTTVQNTPIAPISAPGVLNKPELKL